MTRRPDEETRRRLRAEYKESDRREWEAQLPLEVDELRQLLDYLDGQVGLRGCDHTLGTTSKWLAAHDHDVDGATDAFRSLGGACDCEMLANVDPETWV